MLRLLKNEVSNYLQIWDKSIFTTAYPINQSTNQPINDICYYWPGNSTRHSGRSGAESRACSEALALSRKGLAITGLFREFLFPVPEETGKNPIHPVDPVKKNI